uniref:Coiled-coil domain containing 120a n=1 Tax=Cyclopterus lumpus TaxID=8103 RepID=A0A8C3A6M2_CYCLU
FQARAVHLERTESMEVKGQLISTFGKNEQQQHVGDVKHKERMAELQERRRGLQALLSTRLAELRRICLQEAELTGAVPTDFPLEAGEKPPCVRRRGGTARQGNRKSRSEDEDSQRSKPKKTLFSGALRKHNDPEHNTHIHTHHGKRTVHRGCHTDTVRSESSSTSDSPGIENGNFHPFGLLNIDITVMSHSTSCCTFGFTLKSSEHNYAPVCLSDPRRRGVPSFVSFRTDQPETLQTLKPLPLHPPPPRSQDSSSSSGPSDTGPAVGGGVNAARHSNSSDGLLDRIALLKDEVGSHQRGLWVRGTNGAGAFRSSETLTGGQARASNGLPDGGGVGRGKVGGYSDVLLDYVWGKQQQLQLQQPNSRHPITSQHQLLFNGSSPQPLGAPPTYRDQRRVKVTRTKSCGPFLPVQQGPSETHNPPPAAIQPDPHPHLLPPRPPQLPPAQDAQLEEATRSLHKALALEGKLPVTCTPGVLCSRCLALQVSWAPVVLYTR